MSIEQRIQQHFRDSASLKLEAFESLSVPITAAIDAMFSALANGNKILACGNGSCAAEAQRLATQLIGHFVRARPGLPALALSADSCVLTALGEQDTFDTIYAKQVRALGHAGDVLLVLTASNDARNILEAIAEAHERDMTVVALTGMEGNKTLEALHSTDISICVPSTRAIRIHEIHVLIVHCLCDGIDAMLLGEN